MLSGGGRLYKPFQSGRRSSQEVTFYQQVKTSSPKLLPLIPKFYGVHETENGNQYLVLEDLCSFFESPAIADLKMGIVMTGEDSTPEKARREAAKSDGTTTTSMGFRFSGIWVPQLDGSIKQLDKAWGYSHKANNIVENFKEYFMNGERVRQELLPLFIEKIRPILEWFENSGTHRFYGSSVLMIYEANENSRFKDHVDVRIIDFPHAYPIRDGGRDEGYVLGLKSIIKVLEELSKPEHSK